MRIMTEASGGLTSGYLLKAIRDAGHEAIGTDIVDVCAASKLANEYIVVPKFREKDLWEKTSSLLKEHSIDIVIPSLDETLLGWAERSERFLEQDVSVVLSPAETIDIFSDKWKTYIFFKENDIPTPKTSLTKDYPLVKPRDGRGSAGIFVTDDSDVNMEGMVSQEVLQGTEYTIDCFFDRDGEPIYIVPRVRLNVREGKSTSGLVVQNEKISNFIREMSSNIRFVGPINFQCFENNGAIFFLEINPRIAGGMALGFAATENWVSLIVDNLIHGKSIVPKPVQYGLRMERYYAECFISGR